MPLLLVIDDDPLTLECFRNLFPKSEATVAMATTAAEGLALFAEKLPDAVIVDLRLSDQSGLDVFRRLHDLNATVPVIFITSHGTAETAIEAMRLGAYDYVVKPLDPQPLQQTIQHAFEIGRLMQAPANVVDAEPADDPADLLVGNCPGMQHVYKEIGRVAPRNVTVLILGESGTGKELVARAVYQYSRRSNRPFLAMNCNAIPETLLESELFGHEKGAFTGAERRRIGMFERCHGGTLFLDEIGDMRPVTQTKILRVLQDGQFERIGGYEAIKVDVRIITATNHDLVKLIEDGRFREDLYYRLNVYTIRLPPLRQRAGDVALLAEHFVRRFSQELGTEVRGINPGVLELLKRYSWPGNVRELQSVLKQAIVHAIGPVLVPDYLPLAIRGEASGRTSLLSIGALDLEAALTSLVEDRLHDGSHNLRSEVVSLVERVLLLQVLRLTGGNQSQAARILGLTRKTLRGRLALLGIVVEHATTVQEEADG
jgi:two-component system nitrogen regulation response regulator GlnG